MFLILKNSYCYFFMNPENSNDILESTIADKLNNYQQSHPILVKVWREYIKKNRILYLQSLVDCDNMIKKIPNINDISIETMLLLSILYENNNDLNN